MYLPVINLALTTCALTFQMTVLYPWHTKLSLQLNALETKLDKLLDAHGKDKEKEMEMEMEKAKGKEKN